LIIKKINESLEELQVRKDLEIVPLERCKQCLVYYSKEFGHLCRWRKENADEPEVPVLTTSEDDPIYLTPVTFNARTVDEELDIFIMYRKQIEPHLPRIMRYALEDLRNNVSVAFIHV
jgi:hypothetical protein